MYNPVKLQKSMQISDKFNDWEVNKNNCLCLRKRKC